MKKFGAVLIAVFFVAGVVASFFAGDYMRDKAHKENQAELFETYISRAIDTVEQKGVTLEGAAEYIASNLWVAHELCDDPEISAELSDLWNTLVYEEDTFAGQEDVLTAKLEEILKRYQ